MWLRTVWNQWAGKYSRVQFHWHEQKRFPEPSHNIYIVGGFSGRSCIVPSQQVCQADATSEQKNSENIDRTPINKLPAEPLVSFVRIRTGECPDNKIGNSSPTVTTVSYRCLHAHEQTQKLVRLAWRPSHARHQSVERGLTHRAWCQRKSLSKSIYNLCVCDIGCPLAGPIRCWQQRRDG